MKRFRDIFIGVIIGCILMISTPVIADSIMTKIDVVLNGVNVQVEGTDVEVNSILYKGSTYLPMRKVAELVGKDVDWNSETKTANIVDKIKEGDDVNDENVIKDKEVTKTENGIIVDSVEYYSPSYINKLLSEFGNYSLYPSNKDKEKLKISLGRFWGERSENQELLIDSIPYEYIGSGTYISKDYYEQTILPLISK